MHLVWENLIPNLVLLWTGKFKGLDEGQGGYELGPTVWEAIGAATVKAGDTIPSAYGPRVPNLSTDSSAYVSAEMWSFWTLYIAPVVLRRRFRQQRYYDHFVRLVRLLHLCLQFDITEKEIDTIEEGFNDWVSDYERLYYQGDPARLPICPVTIHALLHIAESIRVMGPVWCYWAFPMERYCGKLQPAIRSRRFPYASLDRFAVEDAQLTQIKMVHGVAEELSLEPETNPQSGFTHAAYQSCILLPPSRARAPPDNQLSVIASALVTRAMQNGLSNHRRLPISKVKQLLKGARISEWGKLNGLTQTRVTRCARLH
ncbi:hypothetical protein CC2G_007348 [Coprinopsis cinerea AmutBmut pab1-1]|nr:hypothetical protein CC2G_007348 [Coprinopsis cinerea AmutBmut pab1-1]KAG2017883.1 hypothetical protein CC2G_007348 [Coprinopsis cinerea AmutBmut pab1-1]